jgi:hypothetical protein
MATQGADMETFSSHGLARLRGNLSIPGNQWKNEMSSDTVDWFFLSAS